MLKGINNTSNYITVQNGTSSTPYINASVLGAGQVRYNPGTQNIEIYDGSTWHTLNSTYASVDLGPEAKLAIDWATKKMREESRINDLCAKYPGLAKARDNFELFKTLVDAEELTSDQVTTGP